MKEKKTTATPNKSSGFVVHKITWWVAPIGIMACVLTRYCAIHVDSIHPLCMFLPRSSVAFEEANYKISNVLPDRRVLMHDGFGSYMGAFGDLSLGSC